MKLADSSRFVAVFVKRSLQKDLSRVARRVIDAILVAMRISSGKIAHSRRNANRRLDKKIAEVGGLAA